MARDLPPSVSQHALDFRQHRFRLRQDGRFQARMVAHPGVQRSHARHRSVQAGRTVRRQCARRSPLRNRTRACLRERSARGWSFRPMRGWPPNRRARGCAGPGFRWMPAGCAASDLRGGEQRLLHQRAISHHREAAPRLHHARLAERDGEIRTGVRRAVVRLAVQLLVFQKQHRIVRAERRAQQAAGIQGVRGHHHAQARNVGEGHFAALAVIDGAAVQVTRRWARESRRGRQTRRWSASAAWPAHYGAASWPARCNRRTGFRPPASGRGWPCRWRGPRWRLRPAAY